MRGFGGVICDPQVLDRLGISEEEDDVLLLPLPAKMNVPADMADWPPAAEEGYENLDDSGAGGTRTPRASVVPLSKLGG